MRDLPIVCTLQPRELNARAIQLLPGIVASAKARHPIENGFRFEFKPEGEVLTSIIRMIDAERQCRRFLRFQLTVEPAGGLSAFGLFAVTAMFLRYAFEHRARGPTQVKR